MAARRRIVDSLPNTVGVIEIDDTPIEKRIASLNTARLEQLVQEVAALFQGGVKTWELKQGERVVKVKVWESNN